jgi:hypothetical protein
VVHGQRGGTVGVRLDRHAGGATYSCYLTSPKMGEDIEPQATETGGVWEYEVTVCTVDGSPIDVEYY